MSSLGEARLIAGRYRLSAVIGRGGMGVVWRARDELLGRDVAVKELVWPAHLSEGEKRTACRRAVREARVTARLNHRNVIRIFDIIQEDDGCPWIVMELLPYGSLGDLVKEKGPLSPAQAAGIGLGVLAALRAAHAAGVVHRDVKPANILIGPDRVVLTDFGIARSTGPSETTTTDVLLGSPSYMAPERARGEESGPPADLWGLGTTLYTALEGHGPFDRDGDAMASLLAVVADEPAPAVHAGPLLWPVISGLLRKDPSQRLDGAQTERMLSRAVAAASASVVTPRLRRPHGRMAVLAGSAALAVIAASGTTVGLALANSSSHRTTAAASVARPSTGAKTSPPARAHPKPPAQVRVADHGRRPPSARSSANPVTRGAGTAPSPRGGQLDVLVHHSPHGHGRGHHKSG